MKAFFPGSFDPFTAGHYDVVVRALKIFEQVVIGVGVNAGKKTMFTEAERTAFIRAAVKNLPDVSVVSYDGLTAEYCRKNDIGVIIRGVRSATDYDYETVAAQANRFLDHSIDTVYFPSYPEHAFVCSSVVRDIFAHGGDVSKLLPKGVELHRK